MSAAAEVMGLFALVPAMVGPVTGSPEEATEMLVEIALCAGETITIDLGGEDRPAMGTMPCCAKGCHSRKRRHDFDLEQ